MSEAAGHSLSKTRSPFLNCLSVQATRPCAPAGFRPMRSGSEISALRTCDCEIPSVSPFLTSPPSLAGSNGSVVSTVAAAGESTALVPGSMITPGSNGTLSQPVGAIPGGSFASHGVEPAGKFGFSSPQECARNQVEYRVGNSFGSKHVVGVVM